VIDIVHGLRRKSSQPYVRASPTTSASAQTGARVQLYVVDVDTPSCCEDMHVDADVDMHVRNAVGVVGEGDTASAPAQEQKHVEEQGPARYRMAASSQRHTGDVNAGAGMLSEPELGRGQDDTHLHLHQRSNWAWVRAWVRVQVVVVAWTWVWSWYGRVRLECSTWTLEASLESGT